MPKIEIDQEHFRVLVFIGNCHNKGAENAGKTVESMIENYCLRENWDFDETASCYIEELDREEDGGE